MKAFSIIIPVYNEARILRRQITHMISLIDSLKLGSQYEILLVENGSSDKTYSIARELQRRFSRVRIIQIASPSYGQAFKAGIKYAKYPVVFQFDLDFWDLDFLQLALSIIGRYDIVLGSKNLVNSHDGRPLSRRLMSKIVEIVIQRRFKVSLTDTHGLKALNRDKVLPMLDDMVCQNHFFDSELLLRCFYKGFSFKELPVALAEIRKTRFSFLIRLREVIPEVMQLLTVDLSRVKRGKPSVSYYLPKGLEVSV